MTRERLAEFLRKCLVISLMSIKIAHEDPKACVRGWGGEPLENYRYHVRSRGI